MNKLTAYIITFLIVVPCYSQSMWPSASCNSCVGNTHVTTYDLTMTKLRDSPCEYKLTSFTKSAITGISVQISGSGWDDSDDTLVSSTLSIIQEREVQSGATYSVISTHASGYSLGAACKKCIGGSYSCTTLPDPEPDPEPDTGPLTQGGMSGSASPILIDIGQDNFRFGDPGVGVFFDIYGDGNPILMQWVHPGEDDAFLVLDSNGNGVVDDGSELFGEGMRLLLEGNRLAPNGFVGLQQYDRPELGGNDDGFITQTDLIWPELFLWLDQNADGVSQPHELSSISTYGITRLGIIPRENMRRDAAGNYLVYHSRARNIHSGFNRMVDVFFLKL